MKLSSTKPQPSETFWTPARAVLTLAIFSLFAAVGVSSCNSTDRTSAPSSNAPTNAKISSAPPASNPASNPSAATSFPASVMDAQLKTMDGQGFKLSDSNGKVRIIDLWATWCGPCRSEIPHLVDLQKEYGPRGFEVIGLDISPERDTPEGVRAFVDEMKINYKVAFAERDLAIALMRDNGSIPQSFVVGRDGKILKRFIGFGAGTPTQLKDTIEQALND